MVNAEELLKKYYINNPEAYEILLKHSMQVRDYALNILERHPEYKSIDRDFVAEAAMLHDIGIFMCDAARIYCFGSHRYIEHGYLGADLLRQEGLPDHALVCERHTGSGITMENIIKNRYPLPHRDMLPVSVEEKLICYADKFFSKSKPDSMYKAKTIRKKLLEFGKEDAERFDLLHKMFK